MLIAVDISNFKAFCIIYIRKIAEAIKKLQIENFMEYIQTTIAQNFGFSDEETMYSLRDCLRKLQVRIL